MSQRDRQRRLHVENRLAELRARYGDPAPLLDWGEEYFRSWFEHPPPEPLPPAPAPQPAQSVSARPRRKRTHQQGKEAIANLDEV